MIYNKEEFDKYPEIMSKEDMRKACHISKRTAQYLLEFNLIPHVDTGKQTRCYKIRKADIIEYMNNREINPDRYIAPENWYTYGKVYKKAYKIRISPKVPDNEEKIRQFYTDKLADKPDVVDTSDIVELTGYDRRTVGEWIHDNKLRTLFVGHHHKIPKTWLIDWLCSCDYNSKIRKSKKHIDMIWEMCAYIEKQGKQKMKSAQRKGR